MAAAALLAGPASELFNLSVANSADLQRPGGKYFNEALSAASGNIYKESRKDWVDFISLYSLYGYYKGTPFSGGLYAASPAGDRWQFDTDAHAQLVTADGGNAEKGCMTSTGFVWHALSASLSLNGGYGFETTCQWVPNIGSFNDQGFARKAWNGDNGGRWYNFLTDYQVCYYEFSTKSEMLSSGKLHKGDIIWTVDSAAGTGMDGLSVPADNHHLGIYMGDGSSDSWWQSGPVNGDGDLTGAANSVNPIYGISATSSYVVLPFAREDGAQPPVQETTAPPVQETTAPPVQETTAPPVQETTAPPVQETTAPPVQETTAPPVQETTVSPVQETTAPPIQQPTQSTAPVQTETVTTVYTTPVSIPPNSQGWAIPISNPTVTLPSTPVQSWGGGGGAVVVPKEQTPVTTAMSGIHGWGPGGAIYTFTTAAPATTTTTTTAPVTEPPVIETTTAAPPVTETATAAPPVTETTTAAPPVAETTTAAPPVAETTTAAPPVTETTTAAPPVTEPAPDTTVPVTTTAESAAPAVTTSYSYVIMKNSDGVYFNQALKTAGNDSAEVTPQQWQTFLTEFSATDYYTGTPYSLSVYSASPKGDNWQYKETDQPAVYGLTADNGGMESMGFVWHALSNAISRSTGEALATAGQSVPFLGSFNTSGFSRRCWDDSGWYNFISKYKVHYYEFADKTSMLSSGVLHKGDIIWTVDAAGGIGYSGLINIASHHLGIYMGDGSTDLWWSTGPTKGTADFSEIKNAIAPIYGMAEENSYLVIPFAEIGSQGNQEPPAPALKTGDVNGDGIIDSNDASMVLEDYSSASTSGNHSLSAEAAKRSDLNKDGTVDSADASIILQYYSYLSTGGTLSLEDFIKQI